ncbi:MAG: translocation/assembly module TamB domain-containing protein [Trueperaceae bacterium]
MRLRRWLLPGALLALFAALALFPVTDFGREWLLERAVVALEEFGYDLAYGDATGNPWLGVELTGATVAGPGVRADAGTVAVDYFLPSLITGELPLSLELEGLRGSIDPTAFDAVPGGGRRSPIALQLRELSVRDVAMEIDGSPWTLPSLDIEDVSVTRSQEMLNFEATVRSNEGGAQLAGKMRLSPWSLDLEILSADARLARHWWDGVDSGVVQGRLAADAGGVVADAMINGGRVSYLGSSVGELAGPVRYDRGVIKGDLTGEALGGPLSAHIEVNVPAEHWQGSARGRPELDALAAWLARNSLSTDFLDITGNADVELEASGWSSVALSGHGSGGGSILELPLDDLSATFEYDTAVGANVQAGGALAQGPVTLILRPQAGVPQMLLRANGVELTEGLAAGWQVSASFDPDGATGEGVASVYGAVAGRPVTLDGDALLDEDGLQLFLTGSDGLGAGGEGAAVLSEGNLEGRLAVQHLTLPGLSGPLDLALRADGPLAALPLELEVAGAGSEGPAAYGIQSEADFSGSLEGRLIEGEVREIRGALGPLSVNGNVDLSPIRVELEYDLAGVELASDGLTGFDLSNVGLTGADTTNTDLSSAATAGAAQAQLAASGSLSYSAQELRSEARVLLERLAAFDAQLGPLILDVQANWNDGPGGSTRTESSADEIAGEAENGGIEIGFASVAEGEAAVEAAGEPPGEADTAADTAASTAADAQAEPVIVGSFGAGGLQLSLNDPPLSLSGVSVSVTGGLALPTEGRLAADVVVSSSELLISIEPTDEGHDLRLAAQPGLQLGPVTLRQPFEASGGVNRELSSGQLTGTLSGLPWRAEFERNESEVTFDFLAGSAEEGSAEVGNEAADAGERSGGATAGENFNLVFDGTTGNWRAAGNLDLTPFAGAFDLPLTGRVQGDLAYTPEGFTGDLSAEGNASGMPVELNIRASGQRFDLSGRAVTAGLPWRLAGASLLEGDAVLPTLESTTLEATSEYGAVTLRGSELSGSGQLPTEFGPLSLDNGGWSLEGSLASRQAVISTSGSTATVAWGDDIRAQGVQAGARVRADLLEDFTLSGLPGRLDAELVWSAGGPGVGSPDVDEGVGAGQGDIAGEVVLAGQPLALSGDLQALQLSGSLDALELSGALLGTPLIRGTLAIDARIPVDDPADAQVGFELNSGEAALAGRVAARDGAWSATVEGSGLQASYRAGKLSVQAQEAQLHPFLAHPAISGALAADGALVHDALGGWQGELTLSLGDPALAAQLTGTGESLSVTTQISGAQYQAQAAGTLFPSLDVEVSGRAVSGSAVSGSAHGDISAGVSGSATQGGGVALEGTVAGDLLAPRFEGRLTTDELELGPLALPALALELEGDAQSGLSAVGEGVSVTVGPSGLSGNLDLQPKLAGQPQRLQAALSGTIGHPLVDLDVSGTLVNGTARFEGGTGRASLAVDPEPWLPQPLTSSAPAELELTLSEAGSWNGVVVAPITLSGSPLELHANLEGEGVSYIGNATLSHAQGRLVEASIAGEGDDWRASVDLAQTEQAAIAALLPAAGELRPAGTLRLSGNPLAVEVDASITGTLASQPLNLRLTGDSNAGVRVTGTAAGAEVSAFAQESGAEFEISDGTRLDVSGAVNWDEALQLTLDGTAIGRALLASGEYHPGSGTGMLRASLGDTRLELQAESIDGESASGTAIDLHVTNANAEGNAGTFDLRLAGPLTPRASLTGTVEAAMPGAPAPLRAAIELNLSTGGRPNLQLTADGLALRVQEGDAGWQARLDGEGVLAGLFDTDAALSWTQGDGFGGSGHLLLPLGALDSPLLKTLTELGQDSVDSATGDLAVEALLEGDGNLLASLALAGSPVTDEVAGDFEAANQLATAQVVLSARPWEDPSLGGELRFGAELGQLWLRYPGEPLALTGRLALDGTIFEPTASGPLALAGAIDGAGTLEYAGGIGSLAIEGDRLLFTANGELDGRLGLEIETRGLEIEPLLGLLSPIAGATGVDLRANLRRDAGGELTGELSDFLIRSSQSTISGSARLRDGVDAQISLDVELADLLLNASLSAPLRGTLEGSLAGSVQLEATDLRSLAAGTLRGSLRLENARVENPGTPGTGAGLSGSLEVAGVAGDPRLHLALSANGSAAGDLLVDAQPSQGRFVVSSDLRWGPLSTDLEITAAPASITASGRVELPGGGFSVSSSSPSAGTDIVALEGEGRYRDWRLAIDSGTLELTLDANLASLGAGVSGVVSATTGTVGEGDGWLGAEVRELSWGGVSLGDIRVTSESPGAEIQIEGQSITATVRPADGLSWSIERLTLELPQGLRLDASGSGRGAEGNAELVVSGEVAGSAAYLPLSVTHSESSGLTIGGTGEVLGGTVRLSASLDTEFGLGNGDATFTGSSSEAAWQGSLSATGLEIAGAQTDLEGTVSGPADAPTLALEGSANGSYFDVTGTSLISMASQSLDLQIDSQFLDSPLNVDATRGTSAQIVLTSAQQSLTVGFASPGNDVGLGEAGSGADLSGSLNLNVGPLRLALAASEATESAGEGGLALQITAPELPGFTLATTITVAELADPAHLLAQPLVLTGRNGTTGEARFALTPLSLSLEELGYRNEELALEVRGTLGPGATAELSGVAQLLRSERPRSERPRSERPRLLPTLPVEAELPFELSANGDAVSLVSSGELGWAELHYQIASGTASLATALEFGGGTVEGEVTFSPESGPSGRLRLNELPLVVLANEDPLRLSGTFEVTPQDLGVDAQLRGASGSLRATGAWGLGLLLPQEFAPLGGATRRLDLQLGTFDLTTVPWVARRLPYLSAPLSGFLQVQGQRLVGRLVAPDLAVAGEPLPISVDISGTAEELLLSTVVADSPVQLTINAQSVSAVATLERFPLHQLAQAVTGPLDVSAEVTGVARLVLPWGQLQGLAIEVATELIRLERADVVTTGNVSLAYADGELSVNEASFSGAGTWQAQGTVRPDLLDLRLSATDADFGPLLGLVPLLAQYEVGARGSLELRTEGTLEEPLVTLTSSSLDFEIAGTSYRLQGGEATLRDEQLALSASVAGLSPVTGLVEVEGSGQVELVPMRLGDAQFTVQGNANVPGLGEVEGFMGTVHSQPGEPLRLEGTGRLGEPFTIEGTLVPLDLTLNGNDLAIRLPYLLLASAQVDANVRLRWEDALRFSGSVDVDQALFEMGIRPPSTRERSEPNPVASRFVFENVRIRAPARVRFMENFGSAETSLDLTLGGTAAGPTLNGTAQVLRGTIQFSGRDFRITEAQARFDPSRGVLPVLDVTAVTTFEVGRVSPSGDTVRFVSPQSESRFEVILSFTGELEATPGASPPFRLDLAPALSSEALIQEVREDGSTTSPRGLSEPELLSLITLGRLELNAPLAGQAGLATAVAEGAIDTAVDLLFVSELQTALAEALDIDVVEINTTALSSIFGRSSSDPFSVSLRLGGYLSDEVFASYRIGTFDDVRGLYALTNEVNLNYELGPLELDLAGRVNFEDTGIPEPDAELSATIRYEFDGLTGIEGGVDLSDERQQVRFGVTLRW